MTTRVECGNTGNLIFLCSRETLRGKLSHTYYFASFIANRKKEDKKYEFLLVQRKTLITWEFYLFFFFLRKKIPPCTNDHLHPTRNHHNLKFLFFSNETLFQRALSPSSFLLYTNKSMCLTFVLWTCLQFTKSHLS